MTRVNSLCRFLTLAFLVGSVVLPQTEALGLELTLDLESLPGRDGILGTADDRPTPDCPELICGPLGDEWAGIRFTSGELFQTDLFPGTGADNHFISSSPPDATLSIPVFGISVTSHSVWSAVLYALDEEDRVIASDVLPHPSPGDTFETGTLAVSTRVPIHRFTVLADGCSPGEPCDEILNLDDFVFTLVRTDNPGAFRFSSAVYRAEEGDLEAEVRIERTDGRRGRASVEYFLEDASAEAGSDYIREQGTLTWRDGEGGAKTTTISLVDDGEAEPTETLHLLLGSPTGGAGLDGPSAASLVIRDDDRAKGAACVADERTLCLGEDGRFMARVRWQTADGSRGSARTANFFDRDSGVLYFFSPNNAELLLKVLDGCATALESYWVYFAATTDVGFTVTVTDTATGHVRAYRNPVGNAATPVLDSQAFKGCY